MDFFGGEFFSFWKKNVGKKKLCHKKKNQKFS
jgi:hypothetical protein